MVTMRLLKYPKILKMTDQLYQYLKNEWKINNHPRYQHYFDDWVKNLTKTQIYYYNKLWLS